MVTYMTSEKPLNPKQARGIIENPGLSKVMFTPPVKPKGGEIYVFSHDGNLDKANNWRSDKYIWVNKGGCGIPRNSQSFWKISYRISQFATDREVDKRFTKTSYIFKDNPSSPYVLIHYR